VNSEQQGMQVEKKNSKKKKKKKIMGWVGSELQGWNTAAQSN